MKDITIIEKDGDKWVVRLNTFSRPYGVSIPLSSNKDVKIEPGVTYDKEGRMIVNKDEKPLLVPAKLYIPDTYTYEQVLDIIAEVKKKEEKCPICQVIKKEVRSGNVTPAGEDAKPLLTPEEAERLLKKKGETGEIKNDKANDKTIEKTVEQKNNSDRNDDASSQAENETKNTSPEKGTTRKRTSRKKRETSDNHKPTKMDNGEDKRMPLILRFPLLEELRPKRWFR